VDGLFDIFWIGGPSGAPYIICGISLGMADMDLLRRRKAALEPDVSATTAPSTVIGSAGLRSERAVGLPIRAVMSRATRALAWVIPAS
jgi:hypothetical protein